jgi:hypothetical protein
VQLVTLVERVGCEGQETRVDESTASKHYRFEHPGSSEAHGVQDRLSLLTKVLAKLAFWEQANHCSIHRLITQVVVS